MEKWKKNGKEIFGEEERVQRSILKKKQKEKKGRRGRGIEKVEEGSRHMEIY